MNFQKLTKTEQIICNEILNGLSNIEVAEKFYITESTVKTHINNIFKKLGFINRHQFMAAVIRELNFRIARLLNEKYKEEI